MSLWTPDGEVPVGRSGGSGGADQGPSDGGADGAAGMVGGPSLEDLSPEERAQAEAMVAEMAEVQRQILAAPAEQLVANHVVGLYELAAIHLGQPEPDLAATRLAIDAMTAVLLATEGRLGPDEGSLRQALTQLQMAFVQVSAGQASSEAAPAGGGGVEGADPDEDDTGELLD
jgi:hypothetical protein